MARVAVLLFAVGGAGCAQLFGIDETKSAPDAPPGPPTMSLQFDRVSMGAMIVRAPLDLTGQTATYLIEDASDSSGFRRVQPVLGDTKDRWTAEIPEGTAASVEFTVPEQVKFRRLFAFPMRAIKNLHALYEHPNTSTAPTGGVFSVRLALPSGYNNELIRIYAIGPWVYHDFSGAELPAVGGVTVGPVSVPYNTMAFPSAIGPQPIPKLTMADQMVALRYVGNDLTAAATITPFDMTGGTDSVMATLAPVPHAPLDVTIDPMGTTMRLMGTTPQVTMPAMAWYVHAAPAWQLGSNAGPVLNAVGLNPTDSGHITAMYGNPFTSLGWTSLFTWSANRYRTYTVPSFNLPLNLYAGLVQVDDVSAGLQLMEPQGLPVLVSINQMPLNADGLSVTLDTTKAVELSLVADRTPNLYYQWNVYEVAPNAAMPPTALEYKIVYAAHSTETTVKVPGDVFTVGKVYMVRAHCMQGGFPSFASGDLQDRDVPFSYGYLDAGVFTVKAP
jgi:hypothetical protein